MDNVKREVGLRFRRFLSGYKDNRAKLVYLDRIDIMAEENRESLEISYLHLISQVRQRETVVLCVTWFSIHTPFLSLWPTLHLRVATASIRHRALPCGSLNVRR